MAADLYAAAITAIGLLTAIQFPSARYAADPVAFFREILGVEPWARAIELIETVRDNDRVAVKAGRKVAKSHTVAGLALWFYCSFEDARVVMTSTTAQQVERVLWREITMMYARSGKCVACKLREAQGAHVERPCPHSAPVDGDLSMLPHTGLKVHDLERGDFREVYGFTSKQGEAVQGISGTKLLYIMDEASGIPDFVYEAIEGNRAGDAKVLLTGNPTKTEGEFFAAFNDKKLNRDDPESTGYVGLTISSEESPNVVEGRKVIPGLATRSFIREREKEWGRDSPLFKVHVLGEFAIGEDGRIFSVAKIKEAEDRLEDLIASGVPPTGELWIGLDPAGETGMGDESCFAPRRGLRQIKLHTARGLDDDGHIAELRLLVAELRQHERETVYVVMDRSGSIGSSLYGRLRALGDMQRMAGEIVEFEVIGIMPSAKAQRQPNVYDTMRDELAANLALKFKEGAAIVEDVKLSAELHILEWSQRVDGKIKVTPKEEIKHKLGRSPDRYDATAMSWWEPLHIRAPEVAALAPTPAAPVQRSERRFDPFAGRGRWRR